MFNRKYPKIRSMTSLWVVSAVFRLESAEDAVPITMEYIINENKIVIIAKMSSDVNFGTIFAPTEVVAATPNMTEERYCWINGAKAS